MKALATLIMWMVYLGSLGFLGQTLDLGAWVIFIQTALKNDVLNDPKKEMLAQIETEDLEGMSMSFLKIAGAEKFEFFQNSNFMMAVNEHARNIQTNGITSALSEFLNSREQIETKNA